MQDANTPATKADLKELTIQLNSEIDQLRTDMHSDISALEARIDKKLNTVKDEIIRAFQVAEENIRHDTPHIDEVRELDNRITRIEHHIGIPTK